MRVRDLNKQQLEQLKENFYCRNNNNVSYGELFLINELVTDEEVFEEYSDISFTEEDFF